MIGVDPSSEGLKIAASKGLEASHEGVDWLLKQDELPDLLFEATSAYVHREYAPRYQEAGIRAVDLTPAARGPKVIAAVNLEEHLDAMNVNMVTCGGQATVPMVAAVSRVTRVPYAEMVSTVSSLSPTRPAAAWRPASCPSVPDRWAARRMRQQRSPTTLSGQTGEFGQAVRTHQRQQDQATVSSKHPLSRVGLLDGWRGDRIRVIPISARLNAYWLG